MAEARGCGGKDVLADQEAAGLDGHDARIVADSAHVVHMMRQAFEFGHDAAQENRARRHVPSKGGFGGKREGKAVGDRAVARNARRNFRSLIQWRAGAEGLDAPVHIAQPFLQARDGLAVAGEAEMAWLDDARMHGAHGDLVQASAIHGKECVSLARPLAVWRAKRRDRARRGRRAAQGLTS